MQSARDLRSLLPFFFTSLLSSYLISLLNDGNDESPACRFIQFNWKVGIMFDDGSVPAACTYALTLNAVCGKTTHTLMRHYVILLGK